MKISYTFDEVKLKGKKVGKCVCGKRLTRSRMFSQTLNPYNLKDGRLKTRINIIQELEDDRARWTNIPVHCATHGYWSLTESQRKEYDRIGKIEVMAVCGNTVVVSKWD